MTALSASSKDALRDFLRQATTSGKYPAITLGAIGTSGEPLHLDCGGDRVFGEPDKGKVDDRTWFRLDSMTKLVTAVAVLQLVDAGKVSLDSPDLLAQHCPELASLQVLIDVTDGTPHFVPRSKPLTLRHLMTHTSGLSYTFTSELLARYVALDTSLQDAAGTVAGYCYPLVFQPGEKWKYSIGFQWAGILVERVSGMRLSEYFSTHIFKPLGIDDSMSFFPTPDVVAKLQVCCKRDGDKLVHTAGTYPLDAAKVAEAPLRGGGGLFGTAPAYLRFLQGVLASQGGGIISDASFHELFADSLAPDVARQMAKGVAGMLSMDATDDDPQVGHSVGMLVIKADSPHGPKAGSGFWGGLSSTQYWLDPASGLAGICFTQLVAVPPDSFNDLYTAYQRKVYDGLQ